MAKRNNSVNLDSALAELEEAKTRLAQAQDAVKQAQKEVKSAENKVQMCQMRINSESYSAMVSAVKGLGMKQSEFESALMGALNKGDLSGLQELFARAKETTDSGLDEASIPSSTNGTEYNDDSEDNSGTF